MHKNNIIPGYTNFQITMAGRTIVKLSATTALDVYMSYSQWFCPDLSMFSENVSKKTTLVVSHIHPMLTMISICRTQMPWRLSSQMEPKLSSALSMEPDIFTSPRITMAQQVELFQSKFCQTLSNEV